MKKLTQSLGNQQSLLSTAGPTGIFYRDSLNVTGKTRPGCLSTMIREHGILDEDGMEDLHFLFVQFN
jgi:hypothetical protein